MTPRSLMAFCREKGVKSVEIRYTTFVGRRENIQIPVDRLTEELFETGMPLLSSSPHASCALDCVVVPVAETAYLAPARSITTLVLVAEIQDAVTRREDELDARSILQRAEDAWENAGFGESVLIGQTCEVILTDARKHRSRLNERHPSRSRYNEPQQSFDYEPAIANENIDHARSARQSSDSLLGAHNVASICSEILQQLTDVGIAVNQVCHSDSEPGHCRFHLAAVGATRAADIHLLTCEIIRVAASQNGLSASFMPVMSPSSAMLGWQLRLAAYKENESLMVGSKQMGLSDKAISVTAGILHHLPACTALLNASENSFRRINQLRSQFRKLSAGSSRSAHAIHIVSHSTNANDKCIEVSVADQTCNPYLAIASILMAGINGIEENLTLDENGRCSVPEKSALPTRRLPYSLDRALSRLRSSHDFLLAHDVFSAKSIDTWIRYIRKSRVDAFKPTPSGKELSEHFR